jgi:hypothetical protein
VGGDRVLVFDLDLELAERVPARTRRRPRRRARRRPGPADRLLGSRHSRRPDRRVRRRHGCLSRDVSILGETVAVDFLAQGDGLHTAVEPTMTSVPADASWSVLEPTRLALLDSAFLAAAQSWPQLTASLLRRHERRCNWLTHVLAISHLPRVETRILLLFWLFGGRWGHKTGSGVPSRSR